MHKSKSVLFNVTYWLSDWWHPVWILRVCSTLQYKIMTSTLFPSYRHTSIRWKYQHSVNYLSTNHNKSLQRVVLLLVGRYGEGWNFCCVIVRHYNENNADVLGNRTRNCVHISRVKLKKIFWRSLISNISWSWGEKRKTEWSQNLFEVCNHDFTRFFLSKVKCLETQLVEIDFLADDDLVHNFHLWQVNYDICCTL